MKILQVNKSNLYDVFLYNGWENHIRIYYKNNKLSFVGKPNLRLTQSQLVSIQIKLKLMEKEQ